MAKNGNPFQITTLITAGIAQVGRAKPGDRLR